MQLKVDENVDETIHGYFNLDNHSKTRLNFTNHDKMKMKWIRFTCFEPASPQQRAWFLPIKGVAFGNPRNLIPRDDGIDYFRDNAVRMRHHITTLINSGVIEEEAVVDEEDMSEAGESMTVSIKCLTQSETYFDRVFAVQCKELKFYFDTCTLADEENIYVYFIQACPNQQDMEQLTQFVPNIENVNDPILPPRILQSVHGFFKLSTTHPTRLDLSNQWDKETLPDTDMTVDGETINTGPVVCFYAIDSVSFNPKEIYPKPHPVSAKYNSDSLTSTLSKLEHRNWIGST